LQSRAVIDCIFGFHAMAFVGKLLGSAVRAEGTVAAEAAEEAGTKAAGTAGRTAALGAGAAGTLGLGSVEMELLMNELDSEGSIQLDGNAAHDTASALEAAHPHVDCQRHDGNAFTCIENKWAMDIGKGVTPHAVEAGMASPILLSVALLLAFAMALVLKRGRIMRYARPQRYQQPPESADLTETEDLLSA